MRPRSDDRGNAERCSGAGRTARAPGSRFNEAAIRMIAEIFMLNPVKELTIIHASMRPRSDDRGNLP